MGETKHDGLAIPGRAILAHEPAFTLGSLKVVPALRQVIAGDGRHRLAPRVMQVLVVLARANGMVVTRGELVDRCWDGRIVGEDAINHAIGKVRRLADRHGAFVIETIPRVGYRLIEQKGDDREARAEVAPGRHLPVELTRRTAIGSGIAIGAIALGGASVALLYGVHTSPPLARTYYQRGLATRGQGYSSQYEQAVGYFGKAVQIDPKYSDAWGALAWSYRTLVAGDMRPDDIRLSLLAKSAADRALDLDPNNADAQATLLLLPPNYRRWSEVEQGCRRLVARHPEHSISQFHLAYVLGETGRWREAIPPMERVCELEPTWPMAKFRLFEALRASGRLEEAEVRIDEALRLAPRNAYFWSTKIAHLLLAGRSAEAIALASEDMAQPVDDPGEIDRTKTILEAYVSGSADKRKLAVDRLLDLARGDDPIMTLSTAITATMLGDSNTAFLLLDGYYFGRGSWGSKRDSRPPTHPLFNFMAAPLHRTSRFARLLQGTGLESFWRKTNTQPDFRRFG